MVLQTQQPIRTVDEFIAYSRLPENVARNLEFMNGKVIDKQASTTQNAQIPLILSAFVLNHCDANGIPCFMTGADGEYCLDDWCFIPDFAYKQTSVSSTYPDRVPPLWAVEVISANENPADKRRKYVQAGILLWEIYADEHVVDVYAPRQSLATYGVGSTIPVEVVPNLRIEVSKLFR